MTELASKDDYQAFSAGLTRLTGIELDYYKRRQMERRTRSFAARQGVEGDLVDYLEVLKSDQHQLDLFLDRMTINVSQLWRNPEHFETLERKVLPEIAAKKSGPKSLKIWSAGCSYGAEAYTLAAICVENRALVGRDAAVFGSDIDARMIEKAEKGWFSEDDARSAPKAMLERYFLAQDGGWQATDELIRLVSFKVENLFDVRPASYDVIVCRNVAIYFTDEARGQLHRTFAQALMPGGFLMVGATEAVTDPQGKGLERAFPFVYRKIDAENSQ